MLLEPPSGEFLCYIDVIDSSIMLIVCFGRRNFADGLQLRTMAQVEHLMRNGCGTGAGKSLKYSMPYFGAKNVWC